MIPSLIIEENVDLRKVKTLISSGEFFGWYSVENSIKDVIKSLVKHHLGTKEFMTAEEKTKKIIRNNAVPTYMMLNR